ncbi:MAG: thiamine pyrophosphate-dependent dehydrogenase E1 component subunit alpha [Candidatus Orphnella occulta]|nr:thiamine pyrophosphate-dependent dehydrogenase E1 component subunit alpha [Candidatus Orphnella occulta]
MNGLKNISKKRLLDMYRMLIKIRNVQLRIEELYHLDEMKTPVHLCLGQEAVSVGVCANLKREDFLFSNHRGHGHYLAKGGSLDSMIAELYCKEAGCSKGRGGSMHLIDTSVGLMGSSSIVGGGIPLAVGAALTAYLKRENTVSVVFFGDGASEEGTLYESMNFAALKKLPVLFVCENNFYSVCSHIGAREPNNKIYMRPKAFDIPSKRVDGTDLLDVYLKVKEAIDYTRSGKGPFFIEARTYRWRGHAGAGDEQKLKYRKMDEWKRWINLDPVAKYEGKLLENSILTERSKKSITGQIERDIDKAFEFGQKSPLPKKRDIMNYLYR